MSRAKLHSVRTAADAEDARLAEAVAACAEEPIAWPGSIQPHGRLLALDAGNGARVLAWSDNQDLPDLAAPCGGALDAPSAERVRLARVEPGGTSHLRALIGTDGRVWSGTLRRPADRAAPCLLELEPDYAGRRESGEILGLVGASLADIAGAGDVARACKVAVSAVRALIGFDRVMAYRFARDWSGEVLAESCAAGIDDAYLGLHFPASDIPAQARALYARAPLRLIPDAAVAPVRLRDRDGAAATLDLGETTLRSVSPVHLAYLANMGVRASLSVSIVRADGSLWGLIACHHLSGPRYVDRETRQAATLVGRALAWRLGEIDQVAGEAGRVAAAALLSALLAADDEPERALAASAARCLDVVGAQGLTLCRDGSARSWGVCPDGATLARIVAALEARPAGADPLAFRSALDLDSSIEGCVGLLALPLGVAGGWMLWFRPELAEVVHWAGPPSKEVERTPSGGLRLAPRHSFAAWSEEVRGLSAPWERRETDDAASLRDVIAAAMLREGGRLRAANERLRARNEELDLFADAAAHDLKEPLWQLQVFGGLLRDDLASGAGNAREMVEMADAIAASATRLRDMVDGLADYARVGRTAARLAPTDLRRLAREAGADFAAQLASIGARAPTPEGDWPEALVCDATQLRRVFQNLLSNAIKYRHPSRALRLSLRASRPAAGGVEIEFEDNGIGFDQAQAETIFEPFRRLRDRAGAAAEGSGLGLAICRRLVQAHGGTIVGIGRPGEGAVFRLTLRTETEPCRAENDLSP